MSSFDAFGEEPHLLEGAGSTHVEDLSIHRCFNIPTLETVSIFEREDEKSEARNQVGKQQEIERSAGLEQ